MYALGMTISLKDLKDTIGTAAHFFKHSEWSLRQFEADIIDATSYLTGRTNDSTPTDIVIQNQFGTLCIFMKYYLKQLLQSNSMGEYAIRNVKKAIWEHLRKDLTIRFPNQIDYLVTIEKGRVGIKWLISISEVD